MTQTTVKTIKKTSELKVGDRVSKSMPSGELVEYIVLAIAPSSPGERDFHLKVVAPNYLYLNSPHSLYCFKDDEWVIPDGVILHDYLENYAWFFKSKSERYTHIPKEKTDMEYRAYLEEYNQRVPPLQQLTLAENDARIGAVKRDWWGNELTSTDETEHLWNLYKKEETPEYKHLYLKFWARAKGVKVDCDRQPVTGFPIFTEEQIKELEALHND